MSRPKIPITVKRPQRTPDGAGGFTVELQEVPGSPFFGRVIHRRNVAYETAMDARPGTMVDYCWVALLPTGADVKVGDTCIAGPAEYRVIRVRNHYRRSIQVDIEVVE